MSADWYFPPHDGRPFWNPLGPVMLADEWGAGESLVRECIQNSLDAGAPGEEVSVTFHVSAPDELIPEAAARWFGSLWPHLRSRDCKTSESAPARPGRGGYILVEDFGTCGLEGDQRQSGLVDEPSHFYSFWRAEGLTGKRANAAGAWGVGKSVFNRTSGIHSYLALTVPRNDPRPVLVGKSLLWQHRVPEGEFQAVGQFGVRHDSSNLILPAIDRQLLRQFVRDFRVLRPLALDNEGGPEAGLSVVIPYPDPEVTADALLTIIIREYFDPIIAGRLRVRVSGRGVKSAVALNQDTIVQEAIKRCPEQVICLLNLALWAGSEGTSNPYVLNQPPTDRGPAWTEGLFRPGSPEFKALAEQFERGESIAVRVPTRVVRDSSPEDSGFDVFLQRDNDGDGYRPIFLRAGIVIPNARERAVRGQSLFALVRIDDDPLALMLRAAEEPGHRFWDDKSENLRGRYAFVRQTIQFIVNAPTFIANTLSNARTERDFDLLADFFPDPDPEAQRPDKSTGKRGRKKPKIIVNPPPPRPRPIRIVQSPGGFSVSRDNPGRTPRPQRVEVRVAYEPSRGDPLKRYDPADFDLQKLKPILMGAAEVECAANRMVFAPTQDNFRLEVNGFDPNRDLFVRARAIDAAAEESQGNEP
jgi:hypothetical protein